MNESAPAVASAQVEVDADPETVWEVLTSIDDWPSWNPDVRSASLEEGLTEGSRFRWKAGPGTITSTLQRIERLYLVGPFQHPGGGVFGAGRATAIKLAEDLKMDLARIPRRALRRAAEFAMSRALRLVSRL